MFLVDLEVLEIPGILVYLVLRDMLTVVLVLDMKLYLVILEFLVNLEYLVDLDFRGILHLVFDKLVVVFHTMVYLVRLMLLVYLVILVILEFLVDLGYLDKMILDMWIVERKILVFLENLENPEILVIQEMLGLQGMKV